MRILGIVSADLGVSCGDQRFKGPYPVGHPDLSEIAGSEAHGVFHSYCNHRELLEFIKGETPVFFFPTLHLPFVCPHFLSKFLLSHHNYPNGIRDFNATFTTSDGEKITKEYEIAKMPPEHRFWQEFPIDIDNVTSCDIRVISSWDGKQKDIDLSAIRFVIDREQEAKKEVKMRDQIERKCLIKEGTEKELADFMLSTTQSLKDLKFALSHEKEQRLRDKEEFKKQSLEAQHSETGKCRIHEKERCPRHLLSKRAVIDSLQSILSQVEQRSESEQFHFSVELEAVQRIVPSLK
ncbi:hypothetical protein ADUPG1_007780 [Aduncisulcus paluster]|uniref:Uncharacterized protein n=1 Tax=Aduncisulcus paluster TaxID=2918883 RepID=A0ABQ5KSP5_9EUKA|nr:hypothetical protein ADUPG1_007780 [Aduncisulcus paluster]